ncbi:hypothetical protein [Streptomyces sp. NPDC092370]|uniref:hypothetical protein n=1 Tax=Streptomyces sp. NPDC092370 TaxID=3366016 RepID=UPI0037F5B65D
MKGRPAAPTATETTIPAAESSPRARRTTAPGSPEPPRWSKGPGLARKVVERGPPPHGRGGTGPARAGQPDRAPALVDGLPVDDRSAAP